MITTTKPIITANAEVFIIPNHATLLSGVLFEPERWQKRAEEVCSANGIEFDPESDWFIETWITAEDDLKSENLADHGFTVVIDGKEYQGYINSLGRNLPASVLPRFEGETREVIIPNCIAVESFKDRWDTDKQTMFDLKLSLTATQKKYRYRNWGNFEDVLNKVTDDNAKLSWFE